MGLIPVPQLLNSNRLCCSRDKPKISYGYLVRQNPARLNDKGKPRLLLPGHSFGSWRNVPECGLGS